MRLPVSVVRSWAWPDLVAAVADIIDDQNRCSGCGLSEDDTWWVAAELCRCPSCADRDLKRKTLKGDGLEGWRVEFRQVEDMLGSLTESASARNTPEGMLQRKRVIAEHRART